MTYGGEAAAILEFTPLHFQPLQFHLSNLAWPGLAWMNDTRHPHTRMFPKKLKMGGGMA